MKLYSVVSVIIFWCGLENTYSIKPVPQSVEDNYWRDFNGLVPSDAVVGGTDDNGVSTYIGQFSIPAAYGQQKSKIHLLPATIKKGSVNTYAPYYGRVVYSNQTNVKILCGSYTSRYKWYSMTSTFPTNCRFVVTGEEDQSLMYTGKATVGKEVITGKIFSDSLNHQPGLIIPLSNGQVSILDNYEVLTYCY
ncbi:hypothetical protein RN001_013068 [Aquatica leii]|uniref:Uncharacterized protein n=1 Tax=Aquatica leii TaxID=1421715 RepID=A0AAN7QCU4_9COLE|nr:hypothetical protein RN001_013068 [Aquatica leii]